MRKYSADELSKLYGISQTDSSQRNRAEGEFKRRELFWVRFTAIVAIVSLIIIGLSSAESLYIEYLNYLKI
jgi:hypothetical protein